jgi:hypothetical protein
MVERFGQLDVGIEAYWHTDMHQTPIARRGPSAFMVDVVRIDHVPVFALWAIAVAEPLGFLRGQVSLRSGVECEWPDRLPFGIGREGKIISVMEWRT